MQKKQFASCTGVLPEGSVESAVEERVSEGEEETEEGEKEERGLKRWLHFLELWRERLGSRGRGPWAGLLGQRGRFGGRRRGEENDET